MLKKYIVEFIGTFIFLGVILSVVNQKAKWAAFAIGLTLTAADYAIYYSNSFDLETRLQSEDRCHRIGTKNNVTYIDIETKNTIDSKIITALRNKKNLADAITKDPKSIFLEKEE